MHGTIIMRQGTGFAVAIDRKRSSALVALLIATSFVQKSRVQAQFEYTIKLALLSASNRINGATTDINVQHDVDVNTDAIKYQGPRWG